MIRIDVSAVLPSRGLLLLVLVALAATGRPTPVAAETSAAEANAAEAASDPVFGDPDASLPGFPDPMEGWNRRVFGFNRQADRWVISPLTTAYTAVVPGIARRSLRRFFANLNSPSIIANDVLQCEWHDAGVSTVRLGVNSTIGIAGFADPATPMGFPEHHSDFGQTLALRGVPSGPYMVFPLVGPTTARDGVGTIVDFAFRPTTYLLGSTVLAELLSVPGAAGIGDQLIYGTIQGGGTGFLEREKHAEELRALEESSVDFYATLRSAYYQSRQAAIWDRREHHKPTALVSEEEPPDRPCRPRGLRSSPAGKFPVPRSRRDRSRRCSPIV
jgi:phospholipid-binding lipoprotein MlaA